jgi:hypothetical protein
MQPSVRDLQQALSIQRQINVLEKRFAGILRGSAARSKAQRALLKGPLKPAWRRKFDQSIKARRRARSKAVGARRRPYEYDHHYGLRILR